MKRKSNVSTLMKCASAAALLVGSAPSAQAFQLFDIWQNPRVTYYVDPSNQDLSSAEALAVMRAAADTWKIQGRSNFEFFYAGPTGANPSIAMDRKNNVFFRNTGADSGPSTIATTYSWSDGAGNYAEFDMVFWDASYTFVADGTCSRGMYLQDVATHEFGHALGLDHTSVAGATMYPTIGYCARAQRNLSSDDIAGVQAGYGALSGAPAPAPSTPAPAPTATQPAPMPTATSPAPMPTATSPAPMPTATSPAPMPTATSPAPMPTATQPAPVPPKGTPAPAPAPVPTSTSPAPVPTSTSPAPMPTKSVPADYDPSPTSPTGSSCPNVPGSNQPVVPVSPNGAKDVAAVASLPCSTDFNAYLRSVGAQAEQVIAAAEAVYTSKISACEASGAIEVSKTCFSAAHAEFSAATAQVRADQQAVEAAIFSRIQACPLNDKQ